MRLTIAVAGTGTDVTVIESGFDAPPGGTRYRRKRPLQNREGWDDEFDELASLLEGVAQQFTTTGESLDELRPRGSAGRGLFGRAQRMCAKVSKKIAQ